MRAPTEDLLAGVRRLCLALPETTEGLTHGGETWFVRRRSFAKFVDPEKHRLDERHVAFWAAAGRANGVPLIAWVTAEEANGLITHACGLSRNGLALIRRGDAGGAAVRRAAVLRRGGR